MNQQTERELFDGRKEATKLKRYISSLRTRVNKAVSKEKQAELFEKLKLAEENLSILDGAFTVPPKCAEAYKLGFQAGRASMPASDFSAMRDALQKAIYAVPDEHLVSRDIILNVIDKVLNLCGISNASDWNVEPTGDQLRTIVKQARCKSSPSDNTGPEEYVYAGWKAALKRQTSEVSAQPVGGVISGENRTTSGAIGQP